MSDHITIFTKEAITEVLAWPIIALGGVLIASILCVGIIAFITLNTKIIERAFLLNLFVGMPLLFICGILCSTVFTKDTGLYKYSGVVDEKVSMVEFYDTYTNVEYKDGIWYWEDKQ